MILRTNSYYFVKFQVLTVASMKMAVFWVVAPYSLVEVYRRFGGICCLHHRGDEGTVLIEKLIASFKVEFIFCQYRANQKEIYSTAFCVDPPKLNFIEIWRVVSEVKHATERSPYYALIICTA
jgi:hypothetical protein